MCFLDFTCEDSPSTSSCSYNPIAEAMEFACSNIVEDCITYESNIDSERVKSSDHAAVSDTVPIENEGTEDSSDCVKSLGYATAPNTDPIENDDMEDLSDCGEEDSDSDSGTTEESGFEIAEENVPKGVIVEEEESDDSGTEYDMLNTPAGIPETPVPNTFLELEVEDFDYEVEVFDWENFQEDIDTVQNMDFSQFLP